ncbi:MAG: small GTP-binding protein [Promethearchaeota archaeon CR_4]|nr:MAG: small GTP-binding protein [Candidatus Lokiarchaeota archaeon CR_4]
MIQNIFYLTWVTDSGGNVGNPRVRVIYPEDVAQIRDVSILKQIIQNHLSLKTSKQVQNQALTFDGVNIYSASVHNQFILGLILEDEDNPYDYEQILTDQIRDYILPKSNSLKDASDFEITTILLGIFIDIRRFVDEILSPSTEVPHSSILKVFLCGLDNVGKTTFVHFLKTGEFISNLMPTRRFNIAHIPLGEVEAIVWDMPGQDIFRNSWLKGAQDSNLFLFMIDLADQKRWDIAKIELWKMLNRFELKGVPLLVLANKLDLVNGNVRRENFLGELELPHLKNRNWNLIFTSIKEKRGIEESIAWIKDQLLRSRVQKK